MFAYRSMLKTALLGVGAVVCRSHRSKLLYYHDVHGATRYTDMGTPLELFARHLDTIRAEGYRIVPHIMADEGEVALLFDDGWRGIYDVRQFFYERRLCPTVFLAVELIGRPGYLNRDEILELQRHGFIFEGHSWSHEDLTQFDDAALQRELVDSRHYLSELLQKPVTALCLPIGYFSDHLTDKALEAGYTTIYSSVPGDYAALVGGRLRARNLLQYASPTDLRFILRGGNTPLRNHYLRMHYRN